MYDNVELVEQLLLAGADPTARDWGNASALDYAYDEIVFETLSRALFRDIQTRDRNALSWLKEYDGFWFGTNAWESTPLSRALGQLDGGRLPPPPPIPIADLDKARSLESQYLAQRESRVLGRVRTLIRIGADPNERATRGGADWTPIAMALRRDLLRAARLLLENGADPNRRSCVTFVLTSFNAVYTHGRPPFFVNKDCTAENGVTPLMMSALRDDWHGAKLLLEFKADRSLKDWAGRTALDYAKDPEVRKLFNAH
jgi:ankyrin repeat protein